MVMICAHNIVKLFINEPYQPLVNYCYPKVLLWFNLILCRGFYLRQSQEVIQEKKHKFYTETYQWIQLGMCLPI